MKLTDLERSAADIEKRNRITVRELIAELQMFDSDAEITFGSNLSADPLIFFRTKDRGDGLVQIELNEVTADYVRNSGE